jgi:hypothetical protein
MKVSQRVARVILAGSGISNPCIQRPPCYPGGSGDLKMMSPWFRMD